MLPALHRARACDQNERQVVAEGDRTDGDVLLFGHHTSRDCSTAALMNEAKSGCGSNGLDFSSGWNCTPRNQGCSGNSTISGSKPSGDMPEKRKPEIGRAHV